MTLKLGTKQGCLLHDSTVLGCLLYMAVSCTPGPYGVGYPHDGEKQERFSALGKEVFLKQ